MRMHLVCTPILYTRRQTSTRCSRAAASLRAASCGTLPCPSGFPSPRCPSYCLPPPSRRPKPHRPAHPEARQVHRARQDRCAPARPAASQRHHHPLVRMAARRVARRRPALRVVGPRHLQAAHRAPRRRLPAPRQARMRRCWPRRTAPSSTSASRSATRASRARWMRRRSGRTTSLT